MVSTAFYLGKEKLRHSLGRPSRSDFVQSEFNIFKDQKEHPAIIKRIAKINLTLSKVLDNVKFINVKKNVHKLFTLLKMKDIYIISEKIANEIEQKLTTDIPQNKNF